MNMPALIYLTVLACAGYAIATVLLIMRARAQARGAGLRGRASALGLGLAAELLHGFALYAVIFQPSGMNLGLTPVASLIGWQIGLVVLLGALVRPTENLAIPVLPAVATSLAIMVVDPTPLPGDIIRHTSWPLDAHILLSLAAYSLLAVAAVQAVVLAIQDYRLRRHQPGGLAAALPPLQLLETSLFQILGAGFILLSLALFAGLLFIHHIVEQHLLHKTVLSIAAWLVFAVLLFGRWRFGWRGRKAIRWTLGGFLILALAYFGSRVVLELFLGRHWMLH